MKVLLFGGTFDPPHNGHMNNLRAALDLVQPDVALVMPAGIPPHKHASGTAEEIRYEMCRCFLALDARVQRSDWEMQRAGRSYTIETLRMLGEKYPGAALYLNIGSDMLKSFTAWRCWQEILQRCTLVVQSREDGDAAALRAAAAPLLAAGGTVLYAKAQPLPCSSTEIRAGVADGTLGGAALKKLLPPPVPEIIEKYKLYTNTNT